MTKRRPPPTPIPSPRAPVVIGPIDEILLDTDFDDIDEMIVFEPPVRAIRGGRILYVDTDEEEDPED